MVLEGNNYADDTLYNINECLEFGCYTFTIYDSFGDGICCSNGQGSYEVTVDGSVVKSGGEFTFSETAQFCGGSTTPSPVATPQTPAPVATPQTPAPVASPKTPSPVATPQTPAPVASPKTPSPVATPQTPAPVASPKTPAPVASPQTCKDSSLRFRVRWNGNMKTRDCTWVSNKATIQRCNVDGVAAACSDTCGTCSTCADSTLRIKVPWNGGIKTRDCIWVGNRATIQRCNVPGVSDACPVTCGVCSN